MKNFRFQKSQEKETKSMKISENNEMIISYIKNQNLKDKIQNLTFIEKCLKKDILCYQLKNEI